MGLTQHEIQIDNKNQQDEIWIAWLNSHVVFLPEGKIRISSEHLDYRFEGGELDLGDALRGFSASDEEDIIAPITLERDRYAGHPETFSLPCELAETLGMVERILRPKLQAGGKYQIRIAKEG